MSVLGYFLLQAAEYGNIGTPEAVYGLLLVADEEEFRRIKIMDFRNSAGRSALLLFGKQENKIPLDHVVVLELVHHDLAEPLLEFVSERQVVFQDEHGKFAHVLECQHALSLLFQIQQGGILLDARLKERHLVISS